MGSNKLLVSRNLQTFSSQAHDVNAFEPFPSSGPTLLQPQPPTASPYLSPGGPGLGVARSPDRELAPSCPTRQGQARPVPGLMRH